MSNTYFLSFSMPEMYFFAKSRNAFVSGESTRFFFQTSTVAARIGG